MSRVVVELYSISMKIKAYTIPELMVVMVISSILSISLWGGYKFVAFQYNDFNNKNAKYNDLFQFEGLLKNDFLKSRLIHNDSDNKLHFEFDNMVSVDYQFENDFVIRSQKSVIDTFALSVSNISIEPLLLENQVSQYIKGVTVDLSLRNRSLQIKVAKKYDNKFIFNALKVQINE